MNHKSVEAGCAIDRSETVAARDGGAKPTRAPLGSPLFGEMYSRRVSERSMAEPTVRENPELQPITVRFPKGNTAHNGHPLYVIVEPLNPTDFTG